MLETDRAEEFSPVKNAEGVDSPATSRRDQIRRAAVSVMSNIAEGFGRFYHPEAARFARIAKAIVDEAWRLDDSLICKLKQMLDAS